MNAFRYLIPMPGALCAAALLLGLSRPAAPQSGPPAPPPLNKHVELEAHDASRRALIVQVFEQAGVRYKIDPPLDGATTIRASGSARTALIGLLRADALTEKDDGGRIHWVDQEYGCRIEPDGTYHVYAKPLWRGLPGRSDLRYATVTLVHPDGTPFKQELESLSQQIGMPCKTDPAYESLTTAKFDMHKAPLPDILASMCRSISTPMEYHVENGALVFSPRQDDPTDALRDYDAERMERKYRQPAQQAP